MQQALTSAALEARPTLRGYAEPVRRKAKGPALGTARALVKDEEIFSEGDRAGFFYKVGSGVVRTSKLVADGRRRIDAFHLPGDILGLETGDEHRFNAEAVGDAAVIAYRRCGLEAPASAVGCVRGRFVVLRGARSSAI